MDEISKMIINKYLVDCDTLREFLAEVLDLEAARELMPQFAEISDKAVLNFFYKSYTNYLGWNGFVFIPSDLSKYHRAHSWKPRNPRIRDFSENYVRNYLTKNGFKVY